ncbi:acetate--CoA ligase [Kyrpidia spormannii]|uniref:acetate--CoA ligase n=1 Tax=Kyrpidia spormannii TaxID=2055160 RepID=A0A6F9E3K5_9BACL|nr:acetate--CoA ligase [Kyrpidia spormannii]CAB3390992.1 acetyl-CoA synthetase [Kyrpidia spormannii]
MDLTNAVPGRPDGQLQDYEAARQVSWDEEAKQFTWWKTGRVNAAFEAVDRHVEEGRGDAPAILYYDGVRDETWSFRRLRDDAAQFGDALRRLGIGRGDRVFLFMPKGPELAVALLGIIRIGAVAGPLFEAFMETAVQDRLADSGAVAVVTTPTLRPRIPRERLPELRHVILVGAEASDAEAGEWSYTELMKEASADSPVEWVDREAPMLLHYTSGSTGKPKGVVHVHNLMIHQYRVGRWVLDLRPDDIYWCTADPGWITGTSAGLFAPWLHGVPVVIRGGRFQQEGWYETVEKFGVTVWFSAPTAFRMLMAGGDELPKRYNLSSLRHVLSAGEPLNPEVFRWGLRALGNRIHDNWWMTETGCTMITNYPALPIKPGSMGRPLPGIEAAILDDQGRVLGPNQLGNLAIRAGWPGMMRAIWNNEEKYKQYFPFEGWYISGDSAYRDEDGYFWFQGRVDDVINTSGERVGPFEVESKLVEHPAVAEAGVIGKPDPVRGEIIKAFISLRQGYAPMEELKQEIQQFVRNGLAAYAMPREIEFRDKLPKTRSGKIMRRVLKAWELGLPTGDLSTMED